MMQEKLISDLHPAVKGCRPAIATVSDVRDFSADVDVVFTATAHEVSHVWRRSFTGRMRRIRSFRRVLGKRSRAFYRKVLRIYSSVILSCWSRRCTVWRSGMPISWYGGI